MLQDTRTYVTEMHLRVSAGTHPGQKRIKNQDAVFAEVRAIENTPAAGLLVVADGMGGHQAGEIASKLAIKAIYRRLKDLFDKPSIDWGEMQTKLFNAVKWANEVVYRYGLENPRMAGGLGTTVTCAVIHNEAVLIANVGDSRAYHLHDGKLKQITVDHSIVAELVQKGKLRPEEISQHPLRKKITRAIGTEPDIAVDIFSCDLAPGDRLLLCSDGLWDMVHSQDEMVNMLSSAVCPDDAVEQLIEAANRHGGGDNIGVVVGEIVVP